MFFKNISQSLLRIEELLLHFTTRQESIDSRARSLDLSLDATSHGATILEFLSTYAVLIGQVTYRFDIYRDCNDQLFCLLPNITPSPYDLVNKPEAGTVKSFGCALWFSLDLGHENEELLSKAILYFTRCLDGANDGANGGQYVPLASYGKSFL